MPINRPARKMIVLGMAAAAIAVAAQTSTPATAARAATRAVDASAGNGGDPNAVPPILGRLRPSELAKMRRAEAQELPRFTYRLPASARYSDVEMNVFAAEGYGGTRAAR